MCGLPVGPFPIGGVGRDLYAAKGFEAGDSAPSINVQIFMRGLE